MSDQPPDTERVPLGVRGPAVLTIIVTVAWLALRVRPALEIGAVLAADFWLIVPIGSLLIRAALPTRDHAAARIALTLGLGYVAATVLVMVLGLLGAMSAAPYCFATLFIAWLWVTRPRDLRTALARLESAASTPACIVTIIICLGVMATTPLMTPIHDAGSAGRISYAYIDAYQSLGFLQSLVRHVPALENAGLAGVPSRLYPDFHYTYLAALQRIVRADPTDIYFCHGAILLVTIGTILGYATGRELTGSRLGGYTLATLLYLGVVPNLYDLNPTLAPVAVPFMPTFYQTHFFSPRFNQHEGAGALMILSASLCVLIATASRVTRLRLGSLILAGVFVGVLARVRSQHLLSMGPGFAALSIALWFRHRDWRWLIGLLALGLTVGAIALQSFSGTYDESTAHLVVRYGTVGFEILDRWFLPARFGPIVKRFPPAIAATVAVVLMVAFRYVGVNLALSIAARWLRPIRAALAWSWVEFFWLCSIAGAIILALTLERDTLTLGLQVIQVTHLLGVLMAFPAVFVIANALRSRLGRWAIAPGVLGAATLVLLAAIAFRGADAALHDQPQRAYIISRDDDAVHEWIRTSTPPTAIIAAHPDHTLNADREPISRVNFLSAMTNRRVYLQRSSIDQRALASDRTNRLRALFAATTTAELCAAAERVPADFVIAYPDTPLAQTPHACLTEVFAHGGTRIYQLARRLD